MSVPEGCLLLQAGRQLEWLTGGAAAAGMHEVCVNVLLRCVDNMGVVRTLGSSVWTQWQGWDALAGMHLNVKSNV